MGEALTVGGIHVEVVKKAIKNLHLTVHPPQGRVHIVAPERMQLAPSGYTRFPSSPGCAAKSPSCKPRPASPAAST